MNEELSKYVRGVDIINKVCYINTASKTGGCSLTKSWIIENDIPDLFKNLDVEIIQYHYSDLDKLPSNCFDGYYIDSDVSVFLSQVELLRFLKTKVGNKRTYIRLHNPILCMTSRKPRDRFELDEVFDKHISFLKYLSDSIINLTFIVANDLDKEVLDLFNIRSILRPFTGIKTASMSDEPVKLHENPNNNVLFVSSYYSKCKGLLTVMNAILNSKLHEFEWYLVGDMFDFRTEHNRDSIEFSNLFIKLLDRRGEDGDVHVIKQVPDVSEYYKKCSHVLIPGFESYSLTAFEAESYGCNIYSMDFNYLKNEHITNGKLHIVPSENMSYETIGYNIYAKLSKLINNQTTELDNKTIINKLLSTRWNSVIRDFEDQQPYQDLIYTF